MSYVAVSKKGIEKIFPMEPIPMYGDWVCWLHENIFYGTELPKGTIKNKLGHELKYEDGPIEIHNI